MASLIKSKRSSYGTVELRDHGAQSPRYAIYVNGQIKEISDDYYYILGVFDQKYN